MKATKTGIYKKWQGRSHSTVSLKGAGGEETGQETTGTALYCICELNLLIHVNSSGNGSRNSLFYYNASTLEES